MTRETAPDGVGPDRGPAHPGKRPSKLGDAAMYAATGGAKVAKAGAYVTGGGLVAVYGAGVADVGAPESTGYESHQPNHGDPVEKTFPDLTAPGNAGPDRGPYPAHPEFPGQLAQDSALTSTIAPGAGYGGPGYGAPGDGPAGQMPSNAVPVIVAPPVAEAFPSFSDTSHQFDWTGMDNLAPEITAVTNGFDTMLHDGQFGGANLFSGVGDGNDIGIFSHIQADSELAIDVSATAHVATELEISNQGIYFDVQTSLQFSASVQAGLEISTTTEVGNVGDQLDNLSQQGGVKSLGLSDTATTPTMTGGVDSLRTGIGTTGSGLGAGAFGAGAPFTDPTQAGINGPENGLGIGSTGAPVGQGPAITALTTSHNAPTIGTSQPSLSLQPVVSTPMQTVIQPDAGLHPIANVTTVTAAGALTAPAASLPLIFGTTSHASAPTAGVTSTTVPATSGTPNIGDHTSLPAGTGTQSHSPNTGNPLTVPKPGDLPGTGLGTHSPLPGAGLPDATLPTHTTTGTTPTGTTPTGTGQTGTTQTGTSQTGTPQTGTSQTGANGTGANAGTNSTGTGGTDSGHAGSDATPPAQSNSTSSLPQQHTPDSHIPDNSVPSLPGSVTSPSLTSPGAGGGADTPGLHEPTVPLQPSVPGPAATMPHTDPVPAVPAVPSVPTAPLEGGISPGGTLVSPLHVGGVSYTLPAHPMEHTISDRLTLSATGHGLTTGLMSAGLPSHTHLPLYDHLHETDHHIIPLMHP